MSNRKLFAAVVLLAVSLIVAVKKLDNGADADGAVAVQEKEETGSNGRLEICPPCELLLQRGKVGQMLHRKGYVACYDAGMRIPLWVAWSLTAEKAYGKVKRTDDFAEDDDVVDGPALADYRGSGWSRGHMCPAGDNRWDKTAMSQSFLLTNMCPQNARLNNGDWKELEEKCRKWAKKYGEIYIVCGPLFYNKRHATIGNGRVVVPEAFYKVVLCLKGKPKAIGFIYKNGEGDRPMGDYVNTVDEVERMTGIDFFAVLDDETEEAVEAEANLAEW